MKVIQYLINSLLPEDIRDYSRSYDKKSLNDMLSLVAEKYPDKYKDIVDNFTRLAGKSVYLSGETVTLDDFKPIIDRDKLFKKLDSELEFADKEIKDVKLKEKTKQDIRERYAKLFEDLTLKEAEKRNNNLYKSVKSGARGNPFQLKAIISTPALYTDYKQQTIPLFIRHSYSDGLSLPEYLAGTYGTRYATMAIKKGTAKAGGLAKEINRAVAESVITSNKDYSNNGILLNIDDDSLYGRVLAKDAAGLKAGTLLDRDSINTLIKNNVQQVVVHSPIATVSAYGLPAEAFGLYYTKKLPSIGAHVGFTAANALTEPFIQGSLSSKHSAGGFSGKRKAFSGFEYLNQFFQSPEHFKDKAPISYDSGTVEKIYDAPQGGKYIRINKKEYYVFPDTEIFVKEGDKVERGQQLSDGLLDPEEVTRISGIGEGRRVLSEIGKKIFDDSGTKANKRNMEVIARGYIDKVEITDPDGIGGAFAGDIVSYNKLEANYVPDKDSKLVNVNNEKDLVDQYLQRPVLNYTIGTRLTPSMIKKIKDSGITDTVLVSKNDVPFRPAYFRIREASTKGSDAFLEKANASYQKSNYVESAIRGNTTNIKENYNPFARLTFPDFANNISNTGKF